MKRLSKFIFIILFLFILTGCGESSTYELSLEGSSNSYYNWTYEIEDPTILTVVDEKYYGKESDDEIKGLDGEYQFKLEALKPGKTKVNFKYIRSWEEEDILYNYVVEFDISDDLSIEKISENGNYLSLEKFLTYDIEKLGLEENHNEYKLIFDNDVVNVEEKECDFLIVYDYNDEIINVYAISRNDNSIYKMVDGKMVIVE